MRTIFSSSIIISIVAVDQLTKVLVKKFEIAGTCNLGFAFGFGPGFFNDLISLAVLIFVSILLIREKKRLVMLGYSLVVSGGLSNLIDRLIRGCVTDFINWPILTRWPAFNLADAAITVGVVILALSMLKDFRVRE